MPSKCHFTGKKTSFGKRRAWRGQAVSKGGFGLKPTGITRRTFKPNLQRVHVTQNGTNKTILACTQCIRSGRVVKAVKAKPFRLPTPHVDGPKKTEAKATKTAKAAAPKAAAPKAPKAGK